MKNITILCLALLIITGCNRLGQAPNVRIGNPEQTETEKEIFQQEGEVCTEQLELKGKC